MAEEVQIPDAGTTAKIRNIIAVPVLSIITLGIYFLVWWYKINKEMADLGRARGTDELGDNPTKSLLAVFPGFLIIVPVFWTFITTFQRVQKTQKLTGATPINGWLGLVLYLVFSPALQSYMQSGLNGVWHAIGIAPVAPSAMPAASEPAPALEEPAPPAADDPAA